MTIVWNRSHNRICVSPCWCFHPSVSKQWLKSDVKLSQNIPHTEIWFLNFWRHWKTREIAFASYCSWGTVILGVQVRSGGCTSWSSKHHYGDSTPPERYLFYISNDILLCIRQRNRWTLEAIVYQGTASIHTASYEFQSVRIRWTIYENEVDNVKSGNNILEQWRVELARIVMKLVQVFWKKTHKIVESCSSHTYPLRFVLLNYLNGFLA